MAWTRVRPATGEMGVPRRPRPVNEHARAAAASACASAPPRPRPASSSSSRHASTLFSTLLLTLASRAAAHGDTLPHPHDGMVHPHPERCTCGVRQIFPLGGPFTGNTAITITGSAFQDLGDAKCRFGVDEVQARVVNATTIECSSPGCASPTCVAGQEETSVPVPVEVSMNGVSFTGSGLQYTYYDMAHVAVSLLTPAGGPRTGATRLHVLGTSFRDMSSGAAGERLQGIKCKYGTNDMVNATRKSGSRSEARCVAPLDYSWPRNGSAGFTGLPLALHPVPLELTFNGYDTIGTLSTSNVPYTFYEPTSFNISWIHPIGGASALGSIACR